MKVDGERDFKVLLVTQFVGMSVYPRHYRGRGRILRDEEGEVSGSLALNAPERVAALSLVVFLQRRKLDAVYYYMRSLAASNPILTAKESLMSLFEETKRKVSLGAALQDGAAAHAGSSALENWMQRGG